FRVNTDQTPRLTGPSVGSDGAGNFVVTWDTSGPKGSGIVARRFSSAGAPLDAAPFLVSSTVPTTGSSSTPDVSVARTTGSFVVRGVPRGGLPGGRAAPPRPRRYDAAGQAQAPEFVVNTVSMFQTAPPHVAVDADGDFAIVWATGPGFTSVFLRTYLPDGT